MKYPFCDRDMEISSAEQKERTYWDAAINRYLPEHFVDNFTDFSDSTCFTYFIGCDGSQFPVGSQDLTAYLKAGSDAYYVKLQISLLAPLMCVLFCKYEKSPTALQISEEPFTRSQQSACAALMRFAEENSLRIVKYSELINTAADASIKGQTAYSYFFEADE